jgi:hypothetical protein
MANQSQKMRTYKAAVYASLNDSKNEAQTEFLSTHADDLPPDRFETPMPHRLIFPDGRKTLNPRGHLGWH